MASLVLCFLIFPFVTGKENYGGESILQHLNSGIKFAKDFLGSESVALKVADFVVKAFQPRPNKPLHNRRPAGYHDVDSEEYSDEETHKDINESSPVSPLRHLVRILGLKPNQISAVAVNALIFVAQMITTFLAGPKHSNKSHRSDDLTSWILSKNSQRLQDLLTTARNESLPDVIEDLIKEHNSDEETSCIRLLVCKITPFINKMQKAVFIKENENIDREIRGVASMYQHLPSNEEISARSDFCEQKHTDCKLYE